MMRNVYVTTEALFQRPGPHQEVLEPAGFRILFPPRPEMIGEDEVAAALADADAVLAGSDVYSAAVLARLPRLKMISRMGVGYDRIDVEAATRHGIAVTITPDANHECVAEHAIALLLATVREVAECDRQIRAGKWAKPRIAPLRGRTLGLVGLGRIGRSVAARALAFRLRVIAHDPYADAEAARQLGVALLPLAEVLQQSDFVSVHALLNDQTRGLICKETLQQMKPGSFLVNTARGGLVVEQDLIDALRAGHLAGAGLDVFTQEPLPGNHPFRTLPNVVLTSHTGGGDTQAIYDMALAAARNIVELYAGHWPQQSLVNPEVRAIWTSGT